MFSDQRSEKDLFCSINGRLFSALWKSVIQCWQQSLHFPTCQTATVVGVKGMSSVFSYILAGLCYITLMFLTPYCVNDCKQCNFSPLHRYFNHLWWHDSLHWRGKTKFTYTLHTVCCSVSCMLWFSNRGLGKKLHTHTDDHTLYDQNCFARNTAFCFFGVFSTPIHLKHI